MKKSIYLITAMVVTAFIVVATASAAEQNKSPQVELQVICSSDLASLGSDVAAAYSQENHGVAVKYTEAGTESLNDFMKYPGRIAVLDSRSLSHLNTKDLRIFTIGREVFVPVMNQGNPWLQQIKETGISPEEFSRAYCAKENLAWSSLVDEGSNAKLNAYRISDASFEKYLSDFLRVSDENLGGKILGSCEDVMHAVSADRYGIGFCKLSQLQGMGGINTNNVCAVPIDINENSRIDQFEAYFGSVDDLARGVWIGKYPTSLTSRIYVVYNQRLSGENETAFIKWLVSDGQAYFNDYGLSTLLEREQYSILAGLDSQPAGVPVADQGLNKSSVFIVVLSFIFGGLLLVFFVLRIFDSNKNAEEKGIIRVSPGAFRSEPVGVPGGYFFDKSHTWAFMEKSGDISVGIDDFLQHVTGRVTKVELRQPGEKVNKGETIFSLIQNGKTLEIKSPITGIIKEKNQKLKENAGLLNTSPYGEGWLYVLEPLNWQIEMKTFLMSEKYKEWVKAELTRLKDFMMTALQPLSSTKIVLQDGGEIKAALMEQLGPEAWEEFQTGFLKN